MPHKWLFALDVAAFSRKFLNVICAGKINSAVHKFRAFSSRNVPTHQHGCWKQSKREGIVAAIRQSAQKWLAYVLEA